MISVNLFCCIVDNHHRFCTLRAAFLRKYAAKLLDCRKVTVFGFFIKSYREGCLSCWVFKSKALAFKLFGFILRQFFITVPDELCEAARIDGCSHLSIIFRIIMPMAKSAIATVVIFTFANCWNEFFQPLIFLSSQSNYTLPLGLAMFSDEGGTKWHLVMAASTLATVPLLTVFYLCQDKFIESMAMSGIK